MNVLSPILWSHLSHWQFKAKHTRISSCWFYASSSRPPLIQLLLALQACKISFPGKPIPTSHFHCRLTPSFLQGRVGAAHPKVLSQDLLLALSSEITHRSQGTMGDGRDPIQVSHVQSNHPNHCTISPVQRFTPLKALSTLQRLSFWDSSSGLSSVDIRNLTPRPETEPSINICWTI